VCIGGEFALTDGSQVGFARHHSPEASDGVFDAALLPRAMGIAEEGFDAEGSGPSQAMMLGELGTIIEADALSQGFWERLEFARDAAGGEHGFAIEGLVDDREAGVALVEDEHILPIFGEQHIVGLPMAWLGPIGGFGGPFGERQAVFDQLDRAAATAPAPSPAGLVARQQAMEIIFLGRAMIDVAID